MHTALKARRQEQATSESADKLLSRLMERCLKVRQTTEQLAAPLSSEDQLLQSMPDASPTKWHLAHTTWFFETFILTPHLVEYQCFHPDFRQLFNSYYNAVGERPLRSNRGLMSRPPLEQIRDYRRHVDEALLRLLERGGADPVMQLIELGLNHEQQHQELIVTDIKHAFWTQPLKPAYIEDAAPEAIPASPLRWLPFSGGIYPVGHEGKNFAFDNEGPRHEVLLQPFEISSRLVTSREYLAFMEDGGYQRPELWLSDGWETVQTNQWNAPLYWIKEESGDPGWQIFTASGVRPINGDAPVCHLSYYEADTYARWAGAHLPTELQWETACGTEQPADSDSAFLEDRGFHPLPARPGDGLKQMFGDCWEWTASPYVGYPGFRPSAGALGEYNGKFMCNQIVLRGGSCATPRSHIRATYRNFFPPQMRWQFAGIRLAR